MGLLTTGGEPMQWGTDANNQAVPHVSAHGIQQFLNIFETKKDLDHCPFLWGEELEHQLIRITDDGVELCLDAMETMERISAREDCGAIWHPEYGSFMAESTPADPYTITAESLCSVEANIRHRVALLDAEAPPGVVGTTFVTFPLMGVGKFITSESTDSPYSESLFIPDVCINRSHPRFANLTANIRLRRGRKVCIQVPLFMDSKTMEATVDKRLNIDYHPRNVDIDCGVADNKTKKTRKFGDELDEGSDDAKTPSFVASPIDPKEKQYPAAEALTHLFTPATMYYYCQYYSEQQQENVKKRYDACPCPVPSVTHPCIYMDCMAFGMGNSCLQVTMQLENVRQARKVYDQLAILCPAFLALSSATPFQKGLLCDSDVRWLTIAASVDDRKREEVPRIIKSRYDSISVFIDEDEPRLDTFNDSPVEINCPYYELLTEKGIDARLAKHIAHLFIRDPLVMYDKMIDIDDRSHTEHFENIQSTNWQTVRFKPPPLSSNIGWRVEFRVMDIQPTPLENAAFSVFVPLLTRSIIKYGCSFYTKMSVVDANMGRAHRINPCGEKYVMRRNIFDAMDDTTEKLSIHEIFNGSEGGFFGLIPLVRRYLNDEGLRCSQLDGYLELLSMRAAGTIPTPAQYLRNFVMKHADYRHDSRITPRIARDLTEHIHALSSGERADSAYIPAHLLGSHKRPRQD